MFEYLLSTSYPVIFHLLVFRPEAPTVGLLYQGNFFLSGRNILQNHDIAHLQCIKQSKLPFLVSNAVWYKVLHILLSFQSLAACTVLNYANLLYHITIQLFFLLEKHICWRLFPLYFLLVLVKNKLNESLEELYYLIISKKKITTREMTGTRLLFQSDHTLKVLNIWVRYTTSSLRQNYEVACECER